MPATEIVSAQLRKQLLSFMEYGEDTLSNFTDTDDTEISCGINQMSCLFEASIEEQLYAILRTFSGNEQLFDAAQIIFSDKISSNYFKATKEVSYQGPISVNPNTGNKIQLFIFTVECLPDLIRKLPVETRKKYFPTIKPK